MQINLKDIRQLFFGSPNMLRESAHAYCLTGWLRLEQAPLPYTPHLLYVCEYSEDLKTYQLTPNMNLLCLLGEQQEPEILSEEFPPHVNILFLKNQNPDAVCTELVSYFEKQCGLGLLADTLLEVLSSEGGVQTMVDHSYPAFGNPIFVFDAGFNLIAANWEEARKIKGGLELIENKGFSSKEFEMANSRGNIHARVRKSDTPIKAHNQELGYEQLLLTIDTQKDLGHIVISATNQPLRHIDSEMLVILKKCIDQQLKKNEFIRNAKGFNYEYFLRDLLDGKIATGKQFFDRLSYVRNEFSGNLYCLVIETARSSNTLNTYYIRSLFENQFPHSKTLMYNGEIIGILSLPENQFLTEQHVDDAIKICRENHLYAGLSNCFQNIMELPEYYKQALRAIELGICTVDKPDLFLYKNYYLEHVKNIFMQKESSQTFCHPKMKLLMNRDKKHTSDLAYTLYMYLTHERNIAATSAAMHMHRNSLVYRIKKITDLIGDDYESYQERQYLILSYEMNCSTANKS